MRVTRMCLLYSFSLGSSIENVQPGFQINWLKMLPIALRAVLYSDCISKFYHASVVREKESGEAAARERYVSGKGGKVNLGKSFKGIVPLSFPCRLLTLINL